MTRKLSPAAQVLVERLRRFVTKGAPKVATKVARKVATKVAPIAPKAVPKVAPEVAPWSLAEVARAHELRLEREARHAALNKGMPKKD